MYWVLADVPSELRSKLTSINLALLCKANDVKQFGYEVVLAPLLKDFATLEKEGFFLPKTGRNIRGSVFCISADNLGFVLGTILSISKRGAFRCFSTKNNREL